MDGTPKLSSAYLRGVYKRLTVVYDPPKWKSPRPAIDELILTVLSQNTNDRNSSEGFRRLKSRFPTWGDVEKAPATEIAEAIKVSGLSNIKSVRIQNILKRIRRDQGRLSLESLKNWDISRANEYLREIPGVGPKTAACVIAFSFGKPIFPVDTHILRVSKRLGILDPKCTADDAHTILQAVVPPDITYPLHIMMIWHGRDTCQARNPKCLECTLLGICDEGRRLTGRRKPSAPLKKLRASFMALTDD